MIFERPAFTRLVSGLILSQFLATSAGIAQTGAPHPTMRAGVRVGASAESEGSTPAPAQAPSPIDDRPSIPGVINSGTQAGGSSFLLPFDPNLKGPQEEESTAPLYKAT